LVCSKAAEPVLCIPLAEKARRMQILRRGVLFNLYIKKTPFLGKGKVGKMSESEFWSERIDSVHKII
jgi:Txe/YoeB family toxin of Txe-Axe toxin-antitoxin module